MCVIDISEAGDGCVADWDLCCLEDPGLEMRIVWVALGVESTSQVRVIWKVSVRRTMTLSFTAVRMKCAPGLKATREEDCL